MSRFTRRLFQLLGSLTGWSLQGDYPPPPFVLVAGPHTSNLDLFVGLYMTRCRGFRPRFLAKKSLFSGPLGWWIRLIGGVPVDRSVSGGLVERAVTLLKAGEVVAVLPKGRRGPGRWKSGFLQMSRLSGAPMVLVGMDYARRTVFVFPAISADTPEDRVMDLARLYLSEVQGRRPDWNDEVYLQERS